MTGASESYSVPREAAKLLRAGILNNDLIAPYLPKNANELADAISFEGSDSPSLPINWRFAESISALKGLEAVMVNGLLKEKYNTGPAKVSINTDHAQLFIMSALLWTLDPEGEKLSAATLVTQEGRKQIGKYFSDWDRHDAGSSPYKGAATNIYETKDGRYFHLHGSMNPSPSLQSVGLPEQNYEVSAEQAIQIIGEAVGKQTSEQMQDLATNKFRQAGTICYSTDEFKQSEHGKANSHVGLFEVHSHPNPNQKPCWWPDSPKTSAKRPLAGLKVVDLTRVIAGPAVARGLAELGASVIRVVGPHVTDMSMLHPDLNHGKWNTLLDITKEEDRKTLRELILEADVFLQAYRPFVLDKYGFGEQDILDMCKHRDRGIIYARENCYGWSGPWKERSGWQQISDANCGVSLEFGRAMGNDEPVTPVFPNSDYCTGVCGTSGIISALLQRHEKGGSYTVDIALNYYSRWLVDSVGTYPDEVWQEVWKKSGSQVYRHYHNMGYTIPRMVGGLYKTSAEVLFKPDFFTQYPVANLGGTVIRHPAPVLRFPQGEVEPGFNVGTRTNGVDQPRWPKDLSVEVIT